MDNENEKKNIQKPKKHKLTEEELKALLDKTCMKRQWFLMKKTTDYNKLALFLKINGVDQIELGQKAYTYEVDLKDETIGGAFILTEKPVGSIGADGNRIGEGAESGTRWYIAAAIVAPDYRGHDIGKIMFDKMKKLAVAENANAIYVNATEGTPCPDDMDGVEDAASFWKALDFVEWDDGTLVYSL